MSKSIATAAQIRAYYNADEKRMARLTDQERHTVQFVDGKAPRGRIAPGAVSKARGNAATYVVGASKDARVAQASQASALREQAAAAGHSVGKRGPLPKAFLASLKG